MCSSAKSLAALDATRSKRLVVAGGVGANRQLRERLRHRVREARRGALLSAARALHRQRRDDRAGGSAAAGCYREGATDYAFNVRPRWPLSELLAPA